MINIPINSHANENQNTNLSQPNTAQNETSQQLPNAYDVILKLNKQQLEISRLANQIESLQLQLQNLKNFVNSDLETNISNSVRKDLQSFLSSLRVSVNSNYKSMLDTQPPSQLPDNSQLSIKTELSNIPDSESVTLTKDYTNQDSTSEESLENKIKADNQEPEESKVSKEPKEDSSSSKQINQEGAFAYAAAHHSFKKDGVEFGIQKMKAFIENYDNHELIPNAHYWLGEFYLKQENAQYDLAEELFLKVIRDFEDHPQNDMKSKALYRLAMMSKENGTLKQAKRYADAIIKDFPDSSEAKLINSIDWQL